MRLFFLTTILAFSLGGCTFFGNEQDTDTQEENHAQFEAVGFGADHPYLTLRPSGDAHHITIFAAGFGKVQTTDVELTYFSGDVEQGVFDSIALTGGLGEKEIFLGSCSSSTGVTRCYYHEGVENGMVTATYEDGSEKKKRISGAFHLQEISAADGKLESLDRVATITVDPQETGVLYVMSVPLTGLPAPLPNDPAIVGTPYAFVATRDVSIDGKLVFTFADMPDASGIDLYEWNDSQGKWVKLRGIVDRSRISADISSFGIFLAARQVTE